MSRARDNASGTLWLPGQIIQTQYVQFTGTQTINAQDISPITGLEINFTPKYANSKILLRSMVNSSTTYVSTFGFFKNGGYLYNPGSNSNSAGSIATPYYNFDTNGNNMSNAYIEYMDTATSTAVINYKVGGASSWGGTTYNLYINDRSTNDMRSISTFIIQEIAQ